MRGAIPPLTRFAFIAWCSVKAQDKFTFTLPLPHVVSDLFTCGFITKIWYAFLFQPCVLLCLVELTVLDENLQVMMFTVITCFIPVVSHIHITSPQFMPSVSLVTKVRGRVSRTCFNMGCILIKKEVFYRKSDTAAVSHCYCREGLNPSTRVL